MACNPGSEDARAQFAERLRQALHRCGVGPREYARLGRMVGVSKQAARGWLEGQNFPTREHIALLARALGVRHGWLEYGEGPMHPGEVLAESGGAEYSASRFTLDEGEVRLISVYRRLDVTSRAAVDQLINLLSDCFGPEGPRGGDS